MSKAAPEKGNEPGSNVIAFSKAHGDKRHGSADLGQGEFARRVKGSLEEGKGSSTEDRLNKVDEAFDDLIDRVKDKPEVEQEALRAVIEQMRMIAEQMKHVRDMKNLHELKQLMLQHWQELKDLTQGDPTLLEGIQNWGSEFIESKIMFYDLMNEIKDELSDRAHAVETEWSGMQRILGELAGYLDPIEVHRIFREFEKISGLTKDEWKVKKGSGIEDFLESLNNVQTGFDSADIDQEGIVQFLRSLNKVVRELAAAITRKRKSSTDIDAGEVDELFNALEERQGKLSSEIRECTKIFKLAKKLRDTHFLTLFNQSGPEEGRAMAA